MANQKLRLIYIYKYDDNLPEFANKLKIGDTSRFDIKDKDDLKKLKDAALARIAEYTVTPGINQYVHLLHVELAIANDGTSFRDKAIHTVLKNAGKPYTRDVSGEEWFEVDLETAKFAITAVKEGRTHLYSGELSQGHTPITFRKEQEDAIVKVTNYFNNGGKYFLLDAIMRYGKTLVGIEIAKRIKSNRTLVLTHRPVVDSGWQEEVGKIYYERDSKVIYYAKDIKSIDVNFNSPNPLIVFSSMQDLRGSDEVGGSFEKNQEIFAEDWEYIIIDEAHEGINTELAKNVLERVIKENSKVLYLSGTPYNLYENYPVVFNEENSYRWGYIEEQKAKQKDMQTYGEQSEYRTLPRLNIFTYDLGQILANKPNFYVNGYSFSFTEFFRVEKGNFVHENDIKLFLDLLSGQIDGTNNYPFSTEMHYETLRHTLWMLPDVAAARALSRLLRNHDFFGNYFKIINVAGAGDEEQDPGEALPRVLNAIGKDPFETRTITLSCGRLTTGVTVKPWTGILMLQGSENSSAATYMQTIFRAKSPWVWDNNGQEDYKKESYVYDFAPDRALNVIANAVGINPGAGNTATNKQKERLTELLNFNPIISVQGSKMEPYAVESLLDTLKEVTIGNVVNSGFASNGILNQNYIRQIITENNWSEDDFKELLGQSSRATRTMKKAQMNKQGMSKKNTKRRQGKKKDREKTREARDLFNAIVALINAISIRMPAVIYGSTNISIDKITLDNFTKAVNDEDWMAFMPRGVTKEIFEEKYKIFYDPDVFRAAVGAIHNSIQDANHKDKTVLERLNAVVGILSKFRNPDKETVFTPWTTVNRHIYDIFGGISFYNERENKAKMAIVHQDIKPITTEVFNNNTSILELNAKSGLYSLLVAYNIFANEIEGKELTPTEEREIWVKILKENLYIIVPNTMAKMMVSRTLIGLEDVELNIIVKENLAQDIKDDIENTINKIYKDFKLDKDMKFDAIVGNPPYQMNVGETTVGGLAVQIYPDFYRLCIELEPKYISLITPSRWFLGNSQAPFRNYIKNYNHFIKIVHFENANELFNRVVIKGGVNYFLWKNSYNGMVNFNGETIELFYNDVVLPNRNLQLLLNKINYNISLNEIISGFNPYGISGKFTNVEKMSSENISPINNIKLHIANRDGKIRWTNINEVKRRINKINKFHIFINRANGIESMTRRFGMPNEVASDTYIAIGPFDTELEIINLDKYIQTKFLRYLVGIKKVVQTIYRNEYEFVPMQDFTNTSDIDWSQDISNIDQQLYKKYNLTQEEIKMIEDKILPL